MNSQEIKKVLEEKALYKSSNLTNENFNVTNIEWLVQNSTVGSILFYKINQDQETLFYERISNANYSLVIVNKKLQNIDLVKNVVVVADENFLEVQKLICDIVWPFNFNAIKFVGVTGTNGKTTTTDLFRQIALEQGYKVLTIGTLGVKKNKEYIKDEGLTTPGYLELRKILYTYAKDVDCVCMEVSSHALIQERVYKIKFDAAAWTSFSQDHLDYHKNLEEYFSAKCILIENHLKPNAVCIIPSYEEELYVKLKKYPSVVKTRTLIERKILDLPLFFSSQFNKCNLEVAWDLNIAIWKKSFTPDLFKFEMTAGRFSVFNIEEKIIIIDFAHTPDALKNICQATKHAFHNSHLTLVFGCGGNRDKTKRPLMGQIAENEADFVFVTSDNPRFEKAKDIIDDILTGMKKSNHKAVENREQAIISAFSQIKPKDVLLIAGKGHENYQIIDGVKHEYTDQSVIEKLKK